MLQISISQAVSTLGISILSASITAGVAHLLAIKRTNARRERKRNNLRLVLRSELRSNTRRLWLIFVANHHIDLVHRSSSERARLQPENADTPEEKVERKKRRRSGELSFLTKQADFGLYYQHYNALIDQIGLLSQQEVEATQTAYREIRALDERLNSLAPSTQYVGEGDDILTTKLMIPVSQIRSRSSSTLVAHFDAISSLKGTLTSLEERQRDAAKGDPSEKDTIDAIHRKVLEDEEE